MYYKKQPLELELMCPVVIETARGGRELTLPVAGQGPFSVVLIQHSP